MDKEKLEAIRLLLGEAVGTASATERAFRAAGYGMLAQRAGKIADELQELIDDTPDEDENE